VVLAFAIFVADPLVNARLIPPPAPAAASAPPAAVASGPAPGGQPVTTPPVSQPGPSLARDSLGQVWVLPPDGSRQLLPDLATYLEFGGDSRLANVHTIDDAELAKRPWGGMAPSAAHAAPPPNTATRPEGDGITFGPLEPPAGSQNVALKRPATRSDGGASAALAVDGNTSGNGADLSISSASDYQPSPWWQVDLGESQQVSLVQIWPRTDACCLDRLTNFNVFVSDNEFASDDPYITGRDPGVASYYVLGSPGAPTTITIGRAARYVRIQMAHPSLLDLAEVQVWSDPAATSSGPLK
jgi:hypothetical protein